MGSIPALRWRPNVGGDGLTWLVATVSDVEAIEVRYHAERLTGHQWVVAMLHEYHGRVFLHDHPDLAPAQEAAHRHVGDE